MNAANILIGAMAGGFCGFAFYRFCIWANAEDAAHRFPELRIRVPQGAEQDPLFRIWCDASRYFPQADGSYRSPRAFLSALSGEIRFEGKDMVVQEVADIGFWRRRFALNAPVPLAHRVRRRKIRQLNKLLRHWQLPETDDQFAFSFKRQPEK